MAMKWIAPLMALGLLAAPRGNADTVTYTYDDAGRLTGITYASGATIAYTYDAAGNLLARTVTAASGSSAAERARSKESKPESSKNVASTQPKPAKRPQRGR